MLKKLVAIGLCMGLLQFTSCKKNSATPAINTPDAVLFPAHADLPYDTTGVAGVYATNILLDTTAAERECAIYFTAWFTQKLSRGFVDSAEIVANGRTLLNNGRYFTGAVDKFVPAAGFRPDTSVAWILSGNASANFTYANADPFPAYSKPLPDTIAKARNNTFTINAATVTDADTVLLKLIVPVGAGSSTVLSYYSSPTTGSIALDSTVVNSLAGKQVGVFINVFSHKELTLHGNKYFFVKEYSLGRNVWFK